MVNAPEGLNKVILRKMKRFDCKTNKVSSKQLATKEPFNQFKFAVLFF